ncbi:MAG: Rdx family protein [Burkholderiales bacterium]
MPRAASLADEISSKCGVQPELVKGAAGVFDVTLNGAVIFSRHRAGRFPDAAEIVTALRAT